MDGLRFRNRREAGQLLATLLAGYADVDDLIVLALPRGGVPVAYEVANALDAPLDVLLVRRLGVPGDEEVAMGAIASGGVRFINDALVRMLHVPESAVHAAVAREARELARREGAYRGDAPAPRVRGRTVILVDDGVATGSSMLAAIGVLRSWDPARIIVAAPVIPADTRELLLDYVDDVVAVIAPARLNGVGLWYRDFRELSDDEVRLLLAGARPDGPKEQRVSGG